MNDREKLIELLGDDVCPAPNCEGCNYECSEDACIRYMKESMADYLISNGVTVQKHGKWILHTSGDATCNECKCLTKFVWDLDNSLNYCPHCGVKMTGNVNKGTCL